MITKTPVLSVRFERSSQTGRPWDIIAGQSPLQQFRAQTDDLMSNRMPQDTTEASVHPIAGATSGNHETQSLQAECPVLTVAQTKSIGLAVRQRMTAITHFLSDVLCAGRTPAFLNGSKAAAAVLSGFPRLPMAAGHPRILWNWLVSVDLYVKPDGTMEILDNNLSCPVGMAALAKLLLP
ncbi:MAG: hypothetical protein KDA85_09840, partial [Planctomycetaceae bacterium]|nr:hypothetical protein [Planctomycetaceae bacterium]